MVFSGMDKIIIGGCIIAQFRFTYNIGGLYGNEEELVRLGETPPEMSWRLMPRRKTKFVKKKTSNLGY